MTYDVQRWNLGKSGMVFKADDGYYVLAADAEAHERAAVSGAYNWGYVDGSKDAREGAIRDCIAAVGACTADKGYVYSDTETGIEWALAAMRALLEEEIA